MIFFLFLFQLQFFLFLLPLFHVLGSLLCQCRRVGLVRLRRGRSCLRKLRCCKLDKITVGSKLDSELPGAEESIRMNWRTHSNRNSDQCVDHRTSSSLGQREIHCWDRNSIDSNRVMNENSCVRRRGATDTNRRIVSSRRAVFKGDGNVGSKINFMRSKLIFRCLLANCEECSGCLLLS